MRRFTLTDFWRRRIAMAGFALAAVLAADAIYQVSVHVRWRNWTAAAGALVATPNHAESQPATASAPAATDPGGPPPKVRAAIKRRNVMTQAFPKEPQFQLTGVLGQTALFRTVDGQEIAIDAGQSNSGIQVTGIDGYAVSIVFRGAKHVLQLFPENVAPGAAPAPPTPGVRPGSGPVSPPSPNAPSNAPATQPGGTVP